MRATPRQPPSRLSAFGAVWLTSLCVVGGFAMLSAVSLVFGAFAELSFGEASKAVYGYVELTTLCQLVAMAAAVRLCLHLAAEPGRQREALALAPFPAPRLALLFAAGLCLQLPLSELSNLLHEHVFGPQSLEEQRAMAQLLAPESPARRVLVWVCLGLAVPAMEELLFRGALLTGMLATEGAAGAVVFSAALFGLCHLQPVAILYAFVSGLWLGVVRLRAGSVAAGVAVHAGVNTLPVVIGPEVFPVSGFNIPSAETAHIPAPLALAGLAVGALLTAVALRGGAKSTGEDGPQPLDSQA